MLYRNTFPEFLEAICIGPTPEFLEKNTTYCEFASGFPQEVELMYDLKSAKKSSNPLNALRNLTKKFIINGPDLDVQTLKFFVQKINAFPPYYSDTVKEEIALAFEAAKLISEPNESLYTPLTTIQNKGDSTITTVTVTNANNTKTITTTVVNNNIGGGSGGSGGGKTGVDVKVRDINGKNIQTSTLTVDANGNPLGSVYINGKQINSNQSITNINAHYITNNTSLHNDKKFLHKLASALKTCKRPCNYFKPMSSSIGTLTDFGRALSDSADVVGAALSDAMHAPTNVSTFMLNQIKPMFRTEFFKLKIMTQDLYRDGVKPFFSKEDRERVKSQLNQGITPDNKFSRLPLTGDTQTYFNTAKSYSKFQATLHQDLGDCYRMHDHGQRFNPYDLTMNAAYSKRKFMGVKNGNVKSLIDIMGSLAPAQYATENTYVKALDVPKDPEFLKHEDTPKARKYDTYDGPSKGSENTITAGATPINPVEASGSAPTPAAPPASSGAGLENVPTNGKIYEFNYGEVKLTAYGYANDECPDSGSEIGFGNAGNMIIPLKTVACSPETGPRGSKMWKSGDVLLITVTDKKGNTWQERRQVGDQSGAGLMKAGGYKFLIDEFVPNRKQYPSKLVDRAKDLKLTIQVADTKEPLAKWNPQEASQFAPIFWSRSDWERVKKLGPKVEGGFMKAKMDTEYISLVKWSPDEPLKPKTVNNKGCT